ncbi:MAG: Oligoendopeptidase F [candidate division TA06 bacterium 32_111]|nr:MAG: Oligoendopeptidase F [candidate division TA06 bacterium 32_111]KUK86703.1 MAG: Oligoendopeptidase F [candidate division TA06 bacterium 34_109]
MEKDFKNLNIDVKGWEDLKGYYDDILKRNINSQEDLLTLLEDFSSLSEFVSETFGWAYINMTRDTQNKEYRDRFLVFNDEIEPKMKEISFEILKKIVNSKYISEIDQEKWGLLIKRFKNEVDIFRKENIPIDTEITKKTMEYQQTIGSMVIKFKGKEYTLPQMSLFLQSKDRTERKEAFESLVEKRLEYSEKIENLLSELTELRNKKAKNANFKNYVELRFRELERFDYGVKECEEFHNSVLRIVTPIYGEIVKEKAKKLNLEKVKPYDLSATLPDEVVLKPFENTEDFIEKSKKVFYSVDRRFGESFEKVVNNKHLDLESRKGKAPGGYNYPLYKTGLPFIFMNSSGIHSDMRTLMHETGHAVHTIAVKDLFTFFYKSTPSEVAEFASMGMELLTYDKWDIFYKDEHSLKQAKRKQLENIINFFPWCAVVDKFQHFIYSKENISPSERKEYFKNIFNEFSEKFVDWSDYEDYMKISYHKQLHIFEHPFYYIEYGIAQLGALQLWINYRENPKKAIDDYLSALNVGSSLSISEVYKKANVKFDFSEKMMEKLINFTYDEYKKVAC